MKNFLRVLGMLVTIAVALVPDAGAQTIRFGFEAGASLANPIYGDSGHPITLNSEPRLSFSQKVSVEVPVTSVLTLQTGVRHVVLRDATDPFSGRVRYRKDQRYLTSSLHILGTLPGFPVYLTLGPEVGYMLSAPYVAVTRDGVEVQYSLTDLMNRWSVHIGAGVGLQAQMLTRTIRIELFHQHGLRKSVSEEGVHILAGPHGLYYNTNWRTRETTLSFGFVF